MSARVWSRSRVIPHSAARLRRYSHRFSTFCIARWKNGVFSRLSRPAALRRRHSLRQNTTRHDRYHHVSRRHCPRLPIETRCAQRDSTQRFLRVTMLIHTLGKFLFFSQLPLSHFLSHARAPAHMHTVRLSLLFRFFCPSFSSYCPTIV